MRQASLIFNGLSIFVLMTALFILQPSHNLAIADLQHNIEQQFATAFKQVMGDGPYFTVFGDIYDSVYAFYDQSSQVTIALLTQPAQDQALYELARNTYGILAHAVSKPKVDLALSAPNRPSADKFMTEAAITNIVPQLTGSVSGAVIDNSDSKPVNQVNQWVTIQDNFTGQMYCLAIYNGEVNKYLGPCKNDYH